ncbi:MAG: methylmalonyl-CoA mutase [Bacteroidetes bacterium]|jgi:methylmalonyl-CoA mutase|nr:methylmalonyl-CoA mutase [Bacteroidota bacterium]
MNLFEEFSPVTAQQWKDQIVKDLKGIDFNQLVWKTNNGFDVKPFYTSEDLKENKSPLFSGNHWDICEQINVKDEKKANEQAINALKGGASGLSFYIHKKIDTKTLIKDISLEHIYTQFFISNDCLHVIDDLKEYYGKKNEFDGKIKCFVNIDPLCLFAFYGEWHDDETKDLSTLNKLVHIPVNVSLYQEAGANTVNELALGLAHLNEYFNYFDNNKTLKDKTLHFIFAVSGDFYNEIAKFRAFRKLVALLQEQYATDFPIHIQAQTAQINKSGLDAYTNMLRTTTEALSAVIGGCDSLSVLPFNYGFEDATEFSSRISRNQQHILREESYLDKVADISAGSYYIETLTDQLAEKAWEQFKVIEKEGGFIAGIKNNFIQDMIAKDAEQLLSQVKEGKMILVGVNKFQDPKEKELKNSFLVKSKEDSKPPYQRIKPIRLAHSYEEEKIKVKL